MIRRVIVAGGGTGGHLFPGMAVVEELKRRTPDLDVLYVGTARGIEARLIPEMGEKLELIEVTPLKGRTAKELAKSLSILPKAMGRATQILRKFRPDLVIGVGGYASGPLLAAASALRIPTALLEQNASVGLTNRLLAPMVGRAYVTYESTAASFGKKKTRVSGNPVRRAFVEAARLALSDPDGAQARSRRILILGGSQGARTLNQLVPMALAHADVAANGFDIVHQTGTSSVAETQKRYDDLGVKATVVPFIDDMARAYASASLVISRAGATTLAEICAMGCASILVPFPHAADDHQRKNAEALSALGAAHSITESELNIEVLSRAVSELLDAPERRHAMADAARKQGHPEAAASIVDDLLSWLGQSSPEANETSESPQNHGGSVKSSTHTSPMPSLVPALILEREELNSGVAYQQARRRHAKVRGARVTSVAPLPLSSSSRS